MAHFLIVTQPEAGHVGPALPISRTLAQRGAEVTWITGRAFRKRVEDSGAEFVAYPEEFDPADKPYYEHWPEPAKLKGIAQHKWLYRNVLYAAVLPLHQVILEIIKRHPVDVMIRCPLTWVDNTCELTGIPLVTLSMIPLAIYSRDTAPYGMGLLPSNSLLGRLRNKFLHFLVLQMLFKDVWKYADEVRLQMGLNEPVNDYFKNYTHLPSLILQLSTPAFEYPRSDLPKQFHYVGPMPLSHTDNFSPPPWWEDLVSGRPVILVNQGTLANNLEDLIMPAIEALKDEDFLVIAVPVTDGSIPSIPKNVRTHAFIPFDMLLPYVTVMVTNGGYGGTQLALAHGIPLVVSGATEDKMEVGRRVEWSESGVNLGERRPSPLLIKKAVKEVLTNKVYRENAQRIAADFCKYDAPKAAADLLEDLAKEKGACAGK